MKAIAWIVAGLATLLAAGCERTPSASPPPAGPTSTAGPASAAGPASQEPDMAAREQPTSSPIDTAVLFDTPVRTLDGQPTSLGAHRGKVLLVVNVASRCGLTPQYAALEKLHQEYAARGFTVVAFPCNQFGGQEPGSAAEIREFCRASYGVTFPMFEKVEVNGQGRHPIYAQLTRVKDAKGEAGDIQWNFEKFLVAADGRSVQRFRPKTEPHDPALLAALEAVLPE